jgi:hypothetical protein
MKTIRWSLLVTLLALAPACAKNTGPDAQSTSAHPVAVQPDAERARAHLIKHVSYPATRAEVLAACAQTKEFNDAEKRWFAENLPEGSYASAQAAMKALKLDVGCAEKDVPPASTCSD